MGCIGAFLQRIRRGMKLDRFRELGRQYPLFCFLLLALLLSTVLLNRRVNNSARQHHRSFTRGTPMSICCKWVSVYGSIMCFFTRFRAACVSCFVRYIHIIMVFWSFLAGVVTFYCSLGPESLLPNIFMSIKPKSKVGQRARVTDFHILLVTHHNNISHSLTTW